MSGIDWSALIKESATVTYPMIQTLHDRIQMRVTESEFVIALAVPRYGHWGIYVRVSPEFAKVVEDLPAELGITYCAPAGKNVTWMGPTQRGKYSIPILTGHEDDFWVGLTIPKEDLETGADLEYEMVQFNANIREAESKWQSSVSKTSSESP